MRIATWNVNGLRARSELLSRWLETRKPDVVGLQELKLPSDQFPLQAFEALGYRAAVYGQKSWNGVALLTREPFEEIARGVSGQEELGARLLGVRVAGLEITTVYCPNGKSVDHPDYARKLAWFDALSSQLEAPTPNAADRVLCGDFNIVPSAIDTWDEAAHRGSIFHTDAERARFQRLLDAGWIDLYRALRPDERAFTWWDYRGGAFHRGFGLRIDLLLGSRSLLSRVKDVQIDRDYRKKIDDLTPSDHAPVYIDLE
jgi:exodeoxyribonuclease-3